MNNKKPLYIQVTIFNQKTYLLNTLFRSEMGYYVQNEYVYADNTTKQFKAKRISYERYERLYKSERFAKFLLMPGLGEWNFCHPEYLRSYFKSIIDFKKS
jgi:hypothetical protein